MSTKYAYPTSDEEWARIFRDVVNSRKVHIKYREADHRYVFGGCEITEIGSVTYTWLPDRGDQDWTRKELPYSHWRSTIRIECMNDQYSAVSGHLWRVWKQHCT